MNTKNIKDKITFICALLFALCGGVAIILKEGVMVPDWIVTASIVIATFCGIIIAFFQGRNPNGSKKSSKQVDEANAQAKE